VAWAELDSLDKARKRWNASVMPTLDEWRADRTSLPQIEVGGFYITTLGASVHKIDDRWSIALLVDDGTSLSVVVGLTDEQCHELDALYPFTPDQWQALHQLLRTWNLANHEILGATTNNVHQAFTQLANTEPRTPRS
jgi:hypothetical protein